MSFDPSVNTNKSNEPYLSYSYDKVKKKKHTGRSSYERITVREYSSASSSSQQKTSRASTRKAMKVFKEHLYYHVTASSSVSSLVDNGFKMSQKKSGLTNISLNYRNLDRASSTHHYFTRSLHEAYWYGKTMKDSGQEPTILRVLIPDTVPLNPDNESPAFKAAYKTTSDIPAALVLPRAKDDLHRDQIRDIQKYFGMEKDCDLKKLRHKMKSAFIPDLDLDVEGIKASSGFVKLERERSEQDLRALQGSGLTQEQLLRLLETGEAISIPD